MKGEFTTVNILQKVFVSHEGLASPCRDLICFSRYARIEIIKSVPKNIQLSKDPSHQIPWRTECLPPP